MLPTNQECFILQCHVSIVKWFKGQITDTTESQEQSGGMCMVTLSGKSFDGNLVAFVTSNHPEVIKTKL